MILLAAIAVMVAVVSATMSERQREGALLRTLGGQQKLLVRSTTIEFALIGFLAGILGVLAAEIAVWALQNRMFEGEFRWHWPVVLVLLRNNCASNISFPFKGIAAHDIDVCLVEPIAGITFSLGKSTDNHGDG